MSDEQEQERDAAVIAEMRNLLTAATPGNWRFKTFSTAMDGDEEIGELTTDGPVVCDVMWATGDWKGKSDWLEFRSEADKVLIERAKEHAETLLRECDRLTAERDAARKDLADLKARLTEIADENIEIDLDYVSVGDDAADAWSTAWGAAGKELREALGLESEDGIAQSLTAAVADVNEGRTRQASDLLAELRKEREASDDGA